jgi:hypothetical protein
MQLLNSGHKRLKVLIHIYHSKFLSHVHNVFTQGEEEQHKASNNNKRGTTQHKVKNNNTRQHKASNNNKSQVGTTQGEQQQQR